MHWSLGRRLRVSTSRRQRSSTLMTSPLAAKIMSKLLAQAMKLKTQFLATMSVALEIQEAIDKDQKWSWAKNQQKLHKCFSYFRQFCGCCFRFSLPVLCGTHHTFYNELRVDFFCPGSLCSEILVKRHMTNRGQTPALPELDRETCLDRGAEDEFSTSPSL